MKRTIAEFGARYVLRIFQGAIQLTVRRRAFAIFGMVALVMALGGCHQKPEDEEIPKEWQKLVKVRGQSYPIPSYWLETPEGKIAHDLVLPDSVSRPVPFSFERQKKSLFRYESDKEVAWRYFNHLCNTEAGQWVFRRVSGVKGIYFARPEGREISASMGDLYGPEAPWVERHFTYTRDTLENQGYKFMEPPFRNYQFVEQPRRDVNWQEDIREPYIRLYGYSVNRIRNSTYYGKPGLERLWYDYKPNTPMKVLGISQPTAEYGFTWRGIARPHDRKFGIAGGELILYRLKDKEVLAAARTFAITWPEHDHPTWGAWAPAGVCQKGFDENNSMAFIEYPLAVLTPDDYQPQPGG